MKSYTKHNGHIFSLFLFFFFLHIHAALSVCHSQRNTESSPTSTAKHAFCLLVNLLLPESEQKYRLDSSCMTCSTLTYTQSTSYHQQLTIARSAGLCLIVDDAQHIEGHDLLAPSSGTHSPVKAAEAVEM